MYAHILCWNNDQAAAALELIATIHRAGVVDDASCLWINATSDVSSAWILAGQSSFVRVVDVPSAGYMRITKDQARWGAKNSDTYKEAGFPYRLSPFPDTCTALLVRHPDLGQRIKVVDGGPSKQVPLDASGRAVVGQVTVVDAAAAKPKNMPSPGFLRQLDAQFHGYKLIRQGIEHPEIEQIWESDPGVLSAEVPAKTLVTDEREVNQAVRNISSASIGLLAKVPVWQGVAMQVTVGELASGDHATLAARHEVPVSAVAAAARILDGVSPSNFGRMTVGLACADREAVAADTGTPAEKAAVTANLIKNKLWQATGGLAADSAA